MRAFLKKRRKVWQLYVLILLPLLYLAIFHYIPMVGAQIAFRNYTPTKGIWGSPWVGLEHFRKFISSYMFPRVMKNTLTISIYSLIAEFPFPIILALSLNYIRNKRYAKVVQTVTYAPYFISTTVMAGILIMFLNTRTGIINNLLEAVAGQRVNFLGMPDYFSSVYVWSGIWQGTGYASIVYIAALAGVDPSLHEAATVDGAGKFRRMLHIDLPSILPTAIIMLILKTGSILSVGFEKAYLLQNSLNKSGSEIISTYVYGVGLTGKLPQYSYATAIGLFQSVVGLLLIVTVNHISRKVADTSLW